jgi:GNAT superfamily N-acetyltransferase
MPSDTITIRPIREEDKGRIVEAFRGLAPQSIYQRFFFHKKELSEQELRRITAPDPARRAVLVATTGREDRIVGLGGYAGSRECAQLEFLVEEDYQGRGIASELLRRLVDLARENGISRLDAHVLASNGPMLSVLRNSGLTATQRETDGVVAVTLFLEHAAAHPGPSGIRRNGDDPLTT